MLLDKNYPTKIIHPSNIFRYPVLRAYFNDDNYSTEKELTNILNKQPNYLIILDIWINKLPDNILKSISQDYVPTNFIDNKDLSGLKELIKNI